MPTLAAIDVGSNAIRLAIAEVDGNQQIASVNLPARIRPARTGRLHVCR